MRRLAEPLLVAHQCRREHRFDPREPAQRRRLVVFDLVPLERIAPEQVLK
jgi:hypothetical protein